MNNKRLCVARDKDPLSYCHGYFQEGFGVIPTVNIGNQLRWSVPSNCCSMIWSDAEDALMGFIRPGEQWVRTRIDEDAYQNGSTGIGLVYFAGTVTSGIDGVTCCHYFLWKLVATLYDSVCCSCGQPLPRTKNYCAECGQELK